MRTLHQEGNIRHLHRRSTREGQVSESRGEGWDDKPDPTPRLNDFSLKVPAQIRADFTKLDRSTSLSAVRHHFPSQARSSVPTISNLPQSVPNGIPPQLPPNEESVAQPKQRAYRNDASIALQNTFQDGSDFLHDTDPDILSTFDPAYRG